jgi:hypothetical protein
MFEMKYNITCGEGDVHGRGCGVTFNTNQPHTKLCHHCRLLAELKFLDKRGAAVRACKLCGTEFARLNTHDSLCVACDDITRWRPGLCALCGQERNDLLADDLHVCLACAKSPARRLELMQWLTGQRGARRQDPERGVQLDAWRRDCVAASREGEPLPAMPRAAAPPMHKPAEGEDLEDWETDVVALAHERWGELEVCDGAECGTPFTIAEALTIEDRPDVRAWLEAHAELVAQT